MEVWPGSAYPLGATFDGSGTNFASIRRAAERVELCLFADDGTETRVPMVDVDAFVWHCYLPGVQPGTRYGYRVHGPWDPANGLRCNPNKLLLDPYAKSTWGAYRLGPGASSATTSGRRTAATTTDSAAHMMHGVVVNPFFDWTGDRRRAPPYRDTIVYEAHVKG